MEKERGELERIRNMTEEERRLEFRNNPKLITNRSAKGKYKFLQKYYHRGAFYLVSYNSSLFIALNITIYSFYLKYFLYFCFQDNEEDVFKRDFSAATLEDHFDKTILPKVMQVTTVLKTNSLG